MADERPLGTVRMKAPTGINACSANQRSYEVDKKGFVYVRPEDVQDLERHGFVNTTE